MCGQIGTLGSVLNNYDRVIFTIDWLRVDLVNHSETHKLSSQLGKSPSFFVQFGIGLFSWVSLYLIPGGWGRGILSNWVFPQYK